MIGVLAAGGKGTRLMPMTAFINKHLCPVGLGQLMIDYPLQTMRDFGFDVVTIVTGCEHAGQISEYVQDGEKYGFRRVNYEMQPKPAGIADVVKRVSHLVDKEGVLLILGDNFFSASQKGSLKDFDGTKAAAWEYGLENVEEAKAFGQIWRDRFDKPMKIVEKPSMPEHARILTGLYFFPADVVDKVNNLSPSARKELEITSLLQLYLEEERLQVFGVEGGWSDLGEWSNWQKHIFNLELQGHG